MAMLIGMVARSALVKPPAPAAYVQVDIYSKMQYTKFVIKQKKRSLPMLPHNAEFVGLSQTIENGIPLAGILPRLIALLCTGHSRQRAQIPEGYACLQGRPCQGSRYG